MSSRPNSMAMVKAGLVGVGAFSGAGSTGAPSASRSRPAISLTIENSWSPRVSLKPRKPLRMSSAFFFRSSMDASTTSETDRRCSWCGCLTEWIVVVPKELSCCSSVLEDSPAPKPRVVSLRSRPCWPRRRRGRRRSAAAPESVVVRVRDGGWLLGRVEGLDDRLLLDLEPLAGDPHDGDAGAEDPVELALRHLGAFTVELLLLGGERVGAGLVDAVEEHVGVLVDDRHALVGDAGAAPDKTDEGARLGRGRLGDTAKRDDDAGAARVLAEAREGAGRSARDGDLRLRDEVPSFSRTARPPPTCASGCAGGARTGRGRRRSIPRGRWRCPVASSRNSPEMCIAAMASWRRPDSTWMTYGGPPTLVS